MPRKHLDSAARREKDLRRLETRTPMCSACPEADSRCLERHHIAGQKHHDDTAILCRNCHRKASDQQLDHPTDKAAQNPALATIGHYLLGLADLFLLIAERLVEFGRWLIEQASVIPPASAETSL